MTIFWSVFRKFITLKFEAMMELCKEILVKVSFDRVLFQKELSKAISWIQSEEIDTFRRWCVKNFGKKYPQIIQAAFRKS